MAETEENIKETQVTNQGGTQVLKERNISSSTTETKLTVANGVWFVAGFIEIVLAFRFFLKVFGANPAAGFVSFVYSISGVFTAPFRGIFNSPTTEGNVTVAVFEWSTLVAMAVYALVAWGVVRLVNIDRSSS